MRTGAGQLSRARRRAVLAVAVAAVAIDTALLGLIAPLLPEIESRTGAGELELGLALAAYAIPVLFVSLPLGRLADTIGRRPLLLAGLLLTAAGSLLIALSSSLEPLIAGRAIQGVGAAASWIAALALVADLAPPGRKGESIGYALAANSVGAIAGPALGGLTGDAISFEFPFLLVAGCSAILALTAAAVLPHDRPAPEPGAASPGYRGLVGIATKGRTLGVTVVVIVGAAGLGLVEVVVPLDADERLGLSASAIGAIFAATVALDAIAAPIAGAAGDRRGRLPVVLFGLLLLSASALLLAFLGAVVGLLVALGVFGIASSTVFAAAVPWLDDAFGSLARGFGYGFLNVLYSIGYTVGPIAAGAALDLAGPRLAYVGLAVAVVAVALVLLWRAPRGAGDQAS